MFFLSKIFVGGGGGSDDSMDLDVGGFGDGGNFRPGAGLGGAGWRGGHTKGTPDFPSRIVDKTSFENPKEFSKDILTSNGEDFDLVVLGNSQIEIKKLHADQGSNSIEDPSADSNLSEPIDQTCLTDNDDYVWTYGDMYIGDFKYGKMHGYGGIFCENGDQYFGNFSLGKIHGSGKFLSATGCSYVGMYDSNKKHGKGT